MEGNLEVNSVATVKADVFFEKNDITVGIKFVKI